MDTVNALGEYLRARRELVRPEDVGLPGGGRRRVPGLRREELAMLAGISSDYYLRLEQGRDRNPSSQILDALADALQLDADGTAYLHELGRPKPRPRAGVRRERVAAGILQLIDELNLPAFVQGRYMDVLASNRLAQTLSPNYRPGTNVLRAVFLDPSERELRRDWDRATESAVNGLRAVAGPEVDDARLNDLVGELSLRSERFRHLWGRHDVRSRTAGVSQLEHPQVGRLELRYEKLAITGGGGQLLVVYHAEPGTPSVERLRLLATVATDGARQSTEAGR